jgi:hypothetical protein
VHGVPSSPASSDHTPGLPGRATPSMSAALPAVEGTDVLGGFLNRRVLAIKDRAWIHGLQVGGSRRKITTLIQEMELQKSDQDAGGGQIKMQVPLRTSNGRCLGSKFLQNRRAAGEDREGGTMEGTSFSGPGTRQEQGSASSVCLLTLPRIWWGWAVAYQTKRLLHASTAAKSCCCDVTMRGSGNRT